MSNLKEIRRRIGSVSSTKQITRAMKLVSAAKLRRAQEAATGGREFFERLEDILSSLCGSLPKDFSHPFLEEKEDKTSKQRFIVVSGERGLCGPYNTNMQKAVEKEIILAKEQGAETDVLALGKRAVTSANFLKWNLFNSFESLPNDQTKIPITEILSKSKDDFTEGRIDELFLFYTHFNSAVNQEVKKVKILPFTVAGLSKKEDAVITEDSEKAEIIDTSSSSEGSDGPGSKVKCDPAPEVIVKELLSVMLSSKLTQSILESRASEHAARMTAMDAATNNASDLISKLKLTYNRARQSSITTELIDIVGGAEATSN